MLCRSPGLCLLGLIAVVVLPAFGDEQPANLLKNPGFEASDSSPSDWLFLASQQDKAQAKIVDEKPAEGKRCLRISGTAEWAAATQRFPIDRSKTYTVSGQVRVNRGAAFIKLDYFEGEKWVGQTIEGYAQGPDSEWKKQSTSSKLDEFPQATYITATVGIGGGDAEADFDDVSLTAR